MRRTPVGNVGTIGTLGTMVPTVGGSRPQRDHPDQSWTIISMSRATDQKEGRGFRISRLCRERRGQGHIICVAHVSWDHGPDGPDGPMARPASLPRLRRPSRAVGILSSVSPPDHRRDGATPVRLRGTILSYGPAPRRALHGPSVRRRGAVGRSADVTFRRPSHRATSRLLLGRTRPTPGSIGVGSGAPSRQPAVGFALRHSSRSYVEAGRWHGGPLWLPPWFQASASGTSRRPLWAHAERPRRSR
jgi:hypothetical protein